MAEPPGLVVRQLACHALRTSLDRKMTVEEAIRSCRGLHLLEPRDRALVSSLVLTSFRHHGEIESIIRTFVDKPLPRKSGHTRDIVTIGVSQLLFLGMPPHAVIDLAVRCAKEDSHARHFSGLVNAVLRKVASAGPKLLEGLDPPRLNTPDWLWERWVKTYGTSLTRDIANAHARRPALDISFKGNARSWMDRLGGVLLPNGQLRLPADHSSVTDLPGFEEGAWWIQDAAATIPARLFGDLRGKAILDLCAAPGGKTLQMAAMGANVTAVDLSAERAKLMHDNLSRTGLKADVIVTDVLSENITDQWDYVLLDAPCSSTGTIRRHPELPWLKQERQIHHFASVQRQLLHAAAERVRPGGKLVFCTCSLEPEEGEMHLHDFLQENDGFMLLPAQCENLPDGAVQPGGWVRTLPCMTFGGEQGMDGFFAAIMQRVR